MSEIRIDRKKRYLGMFDTAKEAALAFDRAVVQHKLASSRLNFPNDVASSGGDEDDENDGDENDDDDGDENDDDDGDENDDDDGDDEALAFPPVPSTTSEGNGLLGNGGGSKVKSSIE